MEVEPFIYKVIVTLESGSIYRIERKNISTGGEPVVLSLKAYDKFIDKDVESGHSYEYIVFDGEAEAYRNQIAIPLDIVSEFSNAFPPSYLGEKISQGGFEKFEINYLVLSKNKPLFTLGRNLRLKVKDFISETGEIHTFPEGMTAPPGQKGRSGGSIIIEAENIEGLITFYMRGEDGGQGLEPPALGVEGKGTKGPPGSIGLEEVICNDDPSGICRPHCRLEPLDGGQGHPGEKGLPGREGLIGGSSGRVYIQTSPEHNYSVRIVKIPGAGGKGSVGGRGGPGGDGGDPGVVAIERSWGSAGDEDDWCLEASRGPQGPEGPRGDPGPQGKKGEEQESCYRHELNQEWICTL